MKVSLFVFLVLISCFFVISIYAQDVSNVSFLSQVGQAESGISNYANVHISDSYEAPTYKDDDDYFIDDGDFVFDTVQVSSSSRLKPFQFFF